MELNTFELDGEFFHGCYSTEDSHNPWLALTRDVAERYGSHVYAYPIKGYFVNMEDPDTVSSISSLIKERYPNFLCSFNEAYCVQGEKVIRNTSYTGDTAVLEVFLLLKAAKLIPEEIIGFGNQNVMRTELPNEDDPSELSDKKLHEHFDKATFHHPEICLIVNGKHELPIVEKFSVKKRGVKYGKLCRMAGLEKEQRKKRKKRPGFDTKDVENPNDGVKKPKGVSQALVFDDDELM